MKTERSAFENAETTEAVSRLKSPCDPWKPWHKQTMSFGDACVEFLNVVTLTFDILICITCHHIENATGTYGTTLELY
jgi:hypothetical protein